MRSTSEIPAIDRMTEPLFRGAAASAMARLDPVQRQRFMAAVEGGILPCPNKCLPCARSVVMSEDPLSTDLHLHEEAYVSHQDARYDERARPFDAQHPVTLLEWLYEGWFNWDGPGLKPDRALRTRWLYEAAAAYEGVFHVEHPATVEDSHV